ncbi:unnamed protein product [Commensalibacter communis]|uniref:Zinc ribbon protein n=1 Tax=Commensalibacter communis TaxID=2972786 RepID=A0A9W4XE72_9PROT|nr:hypothetical protein [Commensalibacter communis]CAI3941672.1 unnamed protein product [Commensalibacter communis]CAI3944953.1 unnamed protein product [Commensalibacter communis]CAI3959142.1 unnamed protein product [Commensalibacter communis]CAI3960922.1 unnamed protein product [Commensalibacter communis]
MNNGYHFISWLFMPLVWAFITAIFAYQAAKRKGRNAPLWGFLSFFCNPLIIVVEYLTNINSNNDHMATCPICSERLSVAAMSCPHCGHPHDRKDRYNLTALDTISILFEIPICIINGLVLLILFCMAYYLLLTNLVISTAIISTLMAAIFK